MPAPVPAIVIGTIPVPPLPATPVIGGFAIAPAIGGGVMTGGITGALPATPAIGAPVLMPGFAGLTGVLVAGDVLWHGGHTAEPVAPHVTGVLLPPGQLHIIV